MGFEFFRLALTAGSEFYRLPLGSRAWDFKSSGWPDSRFWRPAPEQKAAFWRETSELERNRKSGRTDALTLILIVLMRSIRGLAAELPFSNHDFVPNNVVTHPENSGSRTENTGPSAAEPFHDSPNASSIAERHSCHALKPVLEVGGSPTIPSRNVVPVVDVTGQFCTKWNERESTWRKNGSCPSRGTNQSKS